MGITPVRVRSERRSAEWPQILDVGKLQRAGWRPRPFTSFIVKVHSRCNLACDYCYVYTGEDQTWKRLPLRMSLVTAERTALRIAEHARTHGLRRVGVILHGGEPLLAGPEHVSALARSFRSTIAEGIEVDLSVQTNATLLDTAMLDVLLKHGIRVGVSIDGMASDHDARRHGRHGHPSHGDVARALTRLNEDRYRALFAGVLCVVDLRNDPVATYEHLTQWNPPFIDLLLPHANWSDPPARHGRPPTSYGDWLVTVFDRWYDAWQPETTVRLFEEVIRGVLGRPSRVESIGLSPARHIVIETDGAIEQVDALKSAYDGAAQTGRHVDTDTFDDVLAAPQVVARQIGAAALAETCRRCDLQTVCGGGFYAHRYRGGSGFRNPSVYCADLERLVTHVLERVQRELTPDGS